MDIEVFGTHKPGLSLHAARGASPADRNLLPWPGRLLAEEGPTAEHIGETEPQPPPSVVSIAEALTVRETRFFRDILPFELLRTRLLPCLIRSRQESRQLRLWSAGCATGEEAWSLQMLLQDALPQGWRSDLVATDVSTRALRKAEKGEYRRFEIGRGLSEAQRRRFFEPDCANEEVAGRWRVREELRHGVRFLYHDQRNAVMPGQRDLLPQGERFDLILMRNVLLYMTPAERTAALREVHQVLAPDGVLLLGVLEQAEEYTELFGAELDDECYFYRPATAARGANWPGLTLWPKPRIE